MSIEIQGGVICKLLSVSMLHPPTSALTTLPWNKANNFHRIRTNITSPQKILRHIISNRTLLNTVYRPIIRSQTQSWTIPVLLDDVYVCPFYLGW